MSILVPTENDTLVVWSAKKGLRLVVALVALFGLFIAISLATGDNFTPRDTHFSNRAALYCAIVLPLALLYWVAATAIEGLRRRSSQRRR